MDSKGRFKADPTDPVASEAGWNRRQRRVAHMRALETKVKELKAKSERQHQDFENLAARMHEMTEDRNRLREELADQTKQDPKTSRLVLMEKEYDERLYHVRGPGLRASIIDLVEDIDFYAFGNGAPPGVKEIPDEHGIWQAKIKVQIAVEWEK